MYYKLVRAKPIPCRAGVTPAVISAEIFRYGGRKPLPYGVTPLYHKSAEKTMSLLKFDRGMGYLTYSAMATVLLSGSAGTVRVPLSTRASRSMARGCHRCAEVQ